MIRDPQVKQFVDNYEFLEANFLINKIARDGDRAPVEQIGRAHV